MPRAAARWQPRRPELKKLNPDQEAVVKMLLILATAAPASQEDTMARVLKVWIERRDFLQELLRTYERARRSVEDND